MCNHRIIFGNYKIHSYDDTTVPCTIKVINYKHFVLIDQKTNYFFVPNFFRLIHSQKYTSKPSNGGVLKFFVQILDLLNSINKAFGFQIFCTILILLFFGVITTFAFTVTASEKSFLNIRVVLIFIYVHFLTLETSYYGHCTYQEVIKLNLNLRSFTYYVSSKITI